jgi:hypothetical protein
MYSSKYSLCFLRTYTYAHVYLDWPYRNNIPMRIETQIMLNPYISYANTIEYPINLENTQSVHDKQITKGIINS